MSIKREGVKRLSNIITVKSLVKRFGDITAVDDVSFNVERGELFAFLGPNGAGKSTTINILCTLLGKTSGDIEICGFKAGCEDTEIRHRIGVVFQDNCLDNLLTVRQNLIYRAHLYIKDRKKVLQNLDNVCSVLKIGSLLDRPFGKLSGGQKRRCEIARALMNSPEILFLDEPSTGLDPQSRQNVWEIIEKIRKEHGTTVFLTTHYMEEAANATNIAIIDQGKIAVIGTPHKLKQDYSCDILKVIPEDMLTVKSVFEEQDIKHLEKKDLLYVKVPNSMRALEILKRIEKFIVLFEVLHGTMDDVFLNITGKSLRED